MPNIGDARVVDRPHQFPGFCRFCGCESGRMIDTQLSLRGGKIYICLDRCAPVIAKLAGCWPPEEILAAQADLAEAQDEVVRLEGELADVRAVTLTDDDIAALKVIAERKTKRVAA